MLPDASECPGATKSGGRCKATVLLPDGYCFAHSPANQADRDAARRKGGHNKATATRTARLVPSTLRPVLQRLLSALQRVDDGIMPARQAEAMAALAGAIVRIFESAELEERLLSLEQPERRA